MAFPVKQWEAAPSTNTPINAPALIDLETRLSDYTDQEAGVSSGVGPPDAATPGKTYYERDLSNTVVAAWVKEGGVWGVVIGGNMGHIGEVLSLVEVAANYTTDASGASPAGGIPGMTTGEITIPASGKIYIEAYSYYVSVQNAAAAAQLYITEHEVIDGIAEVAGDWVAGAWHRQTTAGYGVPLNPKCHLDRVPGAPYVYKLNISRVVGTGTITVQGNTAWPAWLAVESR